MLLYILKLLILYTLYIDIQYLSNLALYCPLKVLKQTRKLKEEFAKKKSWLKDQIDYSPHPYIPVRTAWSSSLPEVTQFSKKYPISCIMRSSH